MLSPRSFTKKNSDDDESFHDSITLGSSESTSEDFPEREETKDFKPSPLETLFQYILLDNLTGVQSSLSVDQRLLKARDILGRNAFFLAAQRGKTSILQYFLEQTRSELDLTDESNKTPLFVSCQNGHLETASLLLKYKANTEIKEFNTLWTPLVVAIINGHEHIVQKLISSKAKIEIKDSNDQTPLWIAAMLNRTAIIVTLIKSGANINAKDKYGRTPLYIACQKGGKSAVQQLVKYKCNLETPDFDARTPIAIAEMLGFKKIVRILETAGATVIRSEETIRCQKFQGIPVGATEWPHETILCLSESKNRIWGFSSEGSILVWDGRTYELVGYSKKILPTAERAVMVNVADSHWIVNQTISPTPLYIVTWKLDPTEVVSTTIALPMSRSINFELVQSDTEVHSITFLNHEVWAFCTSGFFKVWSDHSTDVHRIVTLNTIGTLPTFPSILDCPSRVVYDQNHWFISANRSVLVLNSEMALVRMLEEEADDILSMVVVEDHLWTTGRFDFVIRIWNWKMGTCIKSLHSAQELILLPGKQILGRIHDKMNIWSTNGSSDSSPILANLKKVSTYYYSIPFATLWVSYKNGDSTIWK